MCDIAVNIFIIFLCSLNYVANFAFVYFVISGTISVTESQIKT